MDTFINGINPYNTQLLEEVTRYERWDECKGKIDSICKAGAFITLDNGEKAFSYECGCLPVGTQIICTVLRKEKEEQNKKMLVGFDSLVDEYEKVC